MNGTAESKRLRHHDRSDLAGEHKLGDAGQVVLLIVFLLIWICDSFFIRYSTVFPGSLPLWIRIPVAGMILAASFYLAKNGLNTVFVEIREEPAVIREGVFGIVRHPVYLGSVLFYLGLIALTLSILSLAVWIVICAFYHFIARHEENLLRAKFGKSYEDYMNEVPMWVPRLNKH